MRGPPRLISIRLLSRKALRRPRWTRPIRRRRLGTAGTGSLPSLVAERATAGRRAGLAERSRRPKGCPWQLASEVEALVCELRRMHPRWGPRRLRAELVLRGVERPPSRSTVYRVLVRRGLVTVKTRRQRREEYVSRQRPESGSLQEWEDYYNYHRPTAVSVAKHPTNASARKPKTHCHRPTSVAHAVNSAGRRSVARRSCSTRNAASSEAAICSVTWRNSRGGL
jgi:Homeodomain-like domain